MKTDDIGREAARSADAAIDTSSPAGKGSWGSDPFQLAALRARQPSFSDAVDTEVMGIDPDALRAGRLARLRQMLEAQDYAGVVLFDPFNQRYATGTRNMFLYYLRNSYRYAFVATDGPIILFDYPQSEHVSAVPGAVDEARVSQLTWSSFMSQDDEAARRFGREIGDLVTRYGRGSRKVGLDRASMRLAAALEQAGCHPVDCQQDMHAARRLKTPEEIACLKLSLADTEVAIDAVREAVRPGVSEQALFARMVQEVVARGGEYVETRLLASGHRTNPWFQEASAKPVRPGDMVALDTDTIGAFGYYADISRTFHCGPGRPTPRQRELYQASWDQVQHNMALIRPGVTHREIIEKAWPIPDKFEALRYPVMLHGIGMHGEAPTIHHAVDFERYGNDGVIEPGMVICIESYMGEVGDAEGVKLEECVVVTDTGTERISRYPFEHDLMTREV